MENKLFGYNNDELELFEIPEVCRYFQMLHNTWPYGLYFFNPETHTIQLLVFCNVEQKVERDGANGAILGVRNANFPEFIESAAVSVFEIAALMGWTMQETSAFLNEIVKLFRAETPNAEVPESLEERRQRHNAFMVSQHGTLSEFACSSHREEGRPLGH